MTNFLVPGKNPDLADVLSSPDTFLLYPGPEALDLSSLHQSDCKRTFVILDGTWDEARKIYQRSPVLQALPRAKLTPKADAKSAYVVRTQPADFCVSTVEAVAMTLAEAEGRPEIVELLLRPLHFLCNAQINHGAVEHDSKEAKEHNEAFVKDSAHKKGAKKSLAKS